VLFDGVVGDKINAPFLEHGETNLLHHEVTGEPIGGFHNDGFGAVRFQRFKHGCEARPGFDGIRALHRFIVIAADYVYARPLRIGLDGRLLPLSLSSPMLAADEVRR
jgi:hypothetical protein